MIEKIKECPGTMGVKISNAIDKAWAAHHKDDFEVSVELTDNELRSLYYGGSEDFLPQCVEYWEINEKILTLSVHIE